MQPHKIVEDYISSVIPEKISAGVKNELKAELESHIYDKAEFYVEIGYDEDAAFKKAVDEMGETETVKTEFAAIYKDSSLKGALMFFGMCIVNLLSVSSFGLGYWYFVEPSMHRFPSVSELTAFLAGLVFITVYTIKCSREKLHKQLSWITWAYAVMALGSCITSGLFYPVLNAAHLLLAYITDSPYPEKDLAVPVNIVLLFVYAFLTFLSLNGENKLRKRPYRLSLRQLTAVLSVLSVCFVVAYCPAYEKYEYSYYDEDTTHYLSDITSEQRMIYSTIKGGDNAAETERALIGKGFEKRSEGYEEYIRNTLNRHIWGGAYLYNINSYLSDKYSENIKGNECSVYCYTHIMDEEDEYDDIISCIIIAYDGNGKINYKLFIPDVEYGLLTSGYLSDSHGTETLKWFEDLTIGERCDSALEFIRSTDSYIIEDVKYEGTKAFSTYKITLDCYCYYDTATVDFLFGVSPATKAYSYIFEFSAEDGVLADGKAEFNYYDYGTDERLSETYKID